MLECDECGLKWDPEGLLIDRGSECPHCQADRAERMLVSLGGAANAADRRIKTLERQVQSLTNRTPEGHTICLSCRKIVPEGKALVVNGGVIHEKCEEVFRRRTQGKVTCQDCSGTGRCQACGGLGHLVIE